MLVKDHQHKTLANLSGVPVKDIETGQFVLNSENKLKVRAAAQKLSGLYKHISIAGQPIEETLSMMRRWLKTDVGYEANGEAKDCLIIFDYIKLMNDSFSKNLDEYQALGFLMTSLHNFAKRHQVPILAFIQLNRDGISKEDTSVIAGSDRISWFCNWLSIFKPFSDEEQAELGSEFNRKLINLIARFGEAPEFGDYICCKFEGKFGRVTEGPTRFQLAKGEFKTDGVEDVKF
jgi:hypothetical protein